MLCPYSILARALSPVEFLFFLFSVAVPVRSQSDMPRSFSPQCLGHLRKGPKSLCREGASKNTEITTTSWRIQLTWQLTLGNDAHDIYLHRHGSLSEVEPQKMVVFPVALKNEPKWGTLSKKRKGCTMLHLPYCEKTRLHVRIQFFQQAVSDPRNRQWHWWRQGKPHNFDAPIVATKELGPESIKML